MFICEFRKIFGSRLVIAIVAILLVMNIGHTLLGCREEQVGEVVNRIMRQYNASPTEYDAYYDELQQLNMQELQNMIAASKAGEDDYVWTLPMTYDPRGRIDDLEILERVYEQKEYQQSHAATVKEIIRRAEINRDDFLSYGFSESSYEVSLQSLIIQHYQNVADNINMQSEYPYGYDIYLSYSAGMVYLMLALLVTVPYIMIQDHSCGMAAILRTTRRGRLHLSRVKVLTVLAVSVLLTLLFSLSCLAAVGITVGYSSPTNAIQAFEQYARVPWAVNMLEYLGLTLLLRLLASLAFGAVLAMVGAFSKQYFATFGSGAVFWGLNLLVCNYAYRGTPPAIKYINLVSVAEAVDITSVFRCVNVLGLAMGLVVVSIVTACLVSVAMLGGAAYGLCRLSRLHLPTRLVQNAARLKSKLFSEKATYAKSRRGVAVTGLFGMEHIKLLPLGRVLILIAVLLLRVLWGAEYYENPHYYSEAVYMKYINTLNGMSAEEQSDYLAQERLRINDVLRCHTAMQDDYISGQISDQEWEAYTETYQLAQVENSVFGRVEKLGEYLTQKRQAGYDTVYVYETGWEKLFSSEPDWFVYAAILMIAAGSFAMEYRSTSSSGSFANILKCTRHGKRRTFRFKILIVAIWSGFLSVIATAMDIITVAVNWSMPNKQAWLGCLIKFENTSANITVIQYVAIIFTVKIIVAVCMGVLVACLSELLRKPIPILGASIILTAAPWLLAQFGARLPVFCDMISMLAGHPLYLYSSASKPTSDFVSMALCIAVMLLATCILTRVVERYYANERFIVFKKGE